MKNITRLFILSALALTMATSCKKEEEKPKSTTPTGTSEYTTCEVNGKSWTSGKTGTYSSDSFPGCEAYINGDTMVFVATRFSDSTGILAQIILKPGRVGTYSGTSTFDQGMFYLTQLDETGLFQAFLMYTTTYSLNISNWDESKKKFSATFSLNMVSNAGGPGYNVTNGKATDVNLIFQ